MTVEIRAIQGYTCRLHSFGLSECCRRATSITMIPRAELVMTVLRRHFPIHLPTKPFQCFLEIIRGGACSSAYFVQDSESRESLIRMTARTFEESRLVRRYLTSITEGNLRRITNRVRVRTNMQVLLGKPIKRCARSEIFHEHPRVGFGPGLAGDLDRSFVYTDLVYRGYGYH